MQELFIIRNNEANNKCKEQIDSKNKPEHKIPVKKVKPG